MSLQPPLETLEIEPTEPANASVIWMHGLGADANDFYGIAPELQLPAGVEVRYVSVTKMRTAFVRQLIDFTSY